MKKVIIGIIIGVLVSGMSVYAGISLSSDKVGYNDTTVKDSLDNLFTEAVSGKKSITTALSNKGFNVTNDSTYSEIVNGINELPVTIAKDEDGNYGYYKDGENSFISFNGSVSAAQYGVGLFFSMTYAGYAGGTVNMVPWQTMSEFVTKNGSSLVINIAGKYKLINLFMGATSYYYNGKSISLNEVISCNVGDTFSAKVTYPKQDSGGWYNAIALVYIPS